MREKWRLGIRISSSSNSKTLICAILLLENGSPFFSTKTLAGFLNPMPRDVHYSDCPFVRRVSVTIVQGSMNVNEMINTQLRVS